VLAHANPAAVLALAALPPVLADTGAAALLALAAPPPVLADAAAAALLAIPALPPVLALLVASHSTFAQPVGRRLTNLEQVLPHYTRSSARDVLIAKLADGAVLAFARCLNTFSRIWCSRAFIPI